MARREGVPVSRRLDFIAARFPLPEHFKRVLPCFLPLSLLQSKRKADDDKQRQVRDPQPRVTRNADAKRPGVSGARTPLGGNLALLSPRCDKPGSRPALISLRGGHVGER